MKIESVGIDICKISRIDRVLANHGSRFMQKVLSQAEASSIFNIHSSENILHIDLKRLLPPANSANHNVIRSVRSQAVASYFSIKESVIKALGSRTFVSPTLRMNEIIIIKTATGKPMVHLSPRIDRFLSSKYSKYSILVSNSNDGGFVSSIALLQTQG